jgi:hypothetical protein
VSVLIFIDSDDEDDGDAPVIDTQANLSIIARYSTKTRGKRTFGEAVKYGLSFGNFSQKTGLD